MADTQTLTLADFLLARISEDEERFEDAVAEEVDNLRHDGMPNMTAEEVRSYWLRGPGSSGDPVEDATTHWRRWLAECEAKRRIVDLLGIAEAHYQEVRVGAPEYVWVQAAEMTRDALLRAAQALALPYADHPDYRPQRRP